MIVKVFLPNEDYKKVLEIAKFLNISINQVFIKAIRFYHRSIFDIDHEVG